MCFLLPKLHLPSLPPHPAPHPRVRRAKESTDPGSVVWDEQSGAVFTQSKITAGSPDLIVQQDGQTVGAGCEK